MEKFKIISKNKLENLPNTAGVYLFFEKITKATKKSQATDYSLLTTRYSLNPIYIGKAINIKDRVKNHFQQPSYRDNLFMNLVEKIGFINTNSEIEALILEANLIKTKQPKFNVVWKDDKNFFYVAIEKNKLGIPYIYITHQPNKNLKFEYIGPFTDGESLKNTLRVLRKIFPFYSSKNHPKTRCTYCHLGLCPGPQFTESLQVGPYLNLPDYKKNVKSLTLILQNKKNTALNLLKKEMAIAVKEQNFEKASKLRDQIYNLQKVMSHSVLTNSNCPTINTPPALATNKLPDLRSNDSWGRTEKLLQKILNIYVPISRIECYDISNIQGTLAVGSMIVFTNGAPNKSQYKKFRIKIKNIPNDIAMLKEVLQRRLLHSDWPYPEIILIDGGKAQLNIGIKIKNINKKTQNIKVISIAKGKQELFIEDKKDPIPLKNLPQEICNLIKNLDDRAHKFAITYHVKLRKKYLLK